MDILAHRGLWTEPAEQNGLDACTDAWRAGFGIETDVRDRLGGLVISHDPAADGALIALPDLLGHHRSIAPGSPLAVNIKSCGLAVAVAKALAEAGTSAAYVFDLAIPDALAYLAAGVAVYTRHSDIEPDPPLYERAAGVWLDSFGPEWWTADTVARHLDGGKSVAIVSPELHRRDHRAVWERLAASDIGTHPGVSICTDFPFEARKVFA
jgi:glycerophosphoryl diester phosphodiesterase